MTRTRIDFDQAEDLEFASQYELEGVKDNNRVPPMFVQPDMNNYDLWLKVVAAGKAGNDCNISMHNAKDRTDYFRCNETNYQVFATHIYRGTGIWTPNLVLAVVSATAVGRTGYIRVWDYTNNAQIAVMNWTAANLNKRFLSTASLTNLTSGNAILEFQIKQSATEVRVHAIGLYIT